MFSEMFCVKYFSSEKKRISDDDRRRVHARVWKITISFYESMNGGDFIYLLDEDDYKLSVWVVSGEREIVNDRLSSTMSAKLEGISVPIISHTLFIYFMLWMTMIKKWARATRV